mmetsp:Transcript_5908/g.15147  ORF Transcript_5908/g.15147 Transcript_5908/m.15147 type:complete len:245 (+) Transcript_5908:62-796(+)
MNYFIIKAYWSPRIKHASASRMNSSSNCLLWSNMIPGASLFCSCGCQHTRSRVRERTGLRPTGHEVGRPCWRPLQCDPRHDARYYLSLVISNLNVTSCGSGLGGHRCLKITKIVIITYVSVCSRRTDSFVIVAVVNSCHYAPIVVIIVPILVLIVCKGLVAHLLQVCLRDVVVSDVPCGHDRRKVVVIEARQLYVGERVAEGVSGRHPATGTRTMAIAQYLYAAMRRVGESRVIQNGGRGPADY